MITKLAGDSFSASADRDDIALRETMKAIRWSLEWNTTVAHPTINGETIGHDNDARPGHFKDRLMENLKHLEVLDTADCTHEAAMAAWDKVFSTEWFSQQPPPEEGSDGSGSKSARSPTRPVEKREGGRYAGSALP